jgi:hypothetical protein
MQDTVPFLPLFAGKGSKSVRLHQVKKSINYRNAFLPTWCLPTAFLVDGECMKSIVLLDAQGV